MASTHSSLDQHDKDKTPGLSGLSGLRSDTAGKPFTPAEGSAPGTVPRAQTAQDKEWVTGIKLYTIMVAITLPCLLLLLDTSIIVTAIPRITTDFHSLQDVGWYGAAYMISSAALQPLTGKFYSNFNSKWTFMSFFALFELGSLLCGVAVSSNMLIIGRAVAGMGASGILNGAFTIIAGMVPMGRRPTLIGIVSGISQLGLAIGPLIGGALTQYTSWRWCFYINLPVGGLVLALIVFVHVPDQAPKPPLLSVLRNLPTKLDLIGFLIFAPAAIMLLLALQYGGETYAWSSSQIIGLFCGAGVTFLIFIAWDFHKGDAAMIPLGMLKKTTVWGSCLSYGFFMSQVFTVSYYLPIYFQSVKGTGPTTSGVNILPTVLPHVAFALLSGALVGKVGYYLPFALAGCICVAISNGLLSTLSVDTSTGKWAGYQILGGVGRGLALQIPVIAVQNTLPFPLIPVAMALLMFSQAFGGALFLSFAQLIFSNGLQTLVGRYAPNVNPQTIVNAGATGLRATFGGAELAGILVAYAKAVDQVFYMTSGLSVAAFASAWFMGFKDIRKKPVTSKA